MAGNENVQLLRGFLSLRQIQEALDKEEEPRIGKILWDPLTSSSCTNRTLDIETSCISLMDDNGCWIASKTVTRTASFALKKKK